MVKDCMSGLKIKPDGVYVDGTLGGGGHAREVCAQLSDKGQLIGVDRDRAAIDAATQVLAMFSDKTLLVRGNFFQLPQILADLNIEEIDGVLLDLGVSSHQLDEPLRGFSYMQDAPLDMRMDVGQRFSAHDVVNSYSEKELCAVIGDYGEERWAKRIAQFIVQRRQEKPIETTFELVSVIKQAMPKAVREDGPHPAKRTFQAIRIEVNEELKPLGSAIEAIAKKLKKGGRICIITFHSLEDRIVKAAFRKLENPCDCPPDLPICVCGKTPSLKIITRKPVTPANCEIRDNPRARSAKLRVAEKI